MKSLLPYWNLRSDGWEHCEYVGITKDLNAMLQSQYKKFGPEKVAYVRALSFAYPQKTAMQEISNSWRALVTSSTIGDDEEWSQITLTQDQLLTTDIKEPTATTPTTDVFDDIAAQLDKLDASRRDEVLQTIAYDDDDDDDDDEETEFYSKDLTQTEETREEDIVSPFTEEVATTSTTTDKLEFNKESVDQILNEIRPYLISDGGNVSVQRVEEDTQNVYLVLEGACGSCPSSTVTMQMGITRVLKENFPNLGEVIQVEENEDSTEGGPTNELNIEAVQAELKRITPAITAMGGIVEIINVDPLGVVELKFRGSTKIQQGLELAILSVPLVKHVKFTN